MINFITGLISPVSKLIDELHTSDEEKMKLRAQVIHMETQLAKELLNYEQKLVESKSEVIKAEATGQSWTQRNWRPVLMLSIVSIVVNNYILLPYASALGAPMVALDLPPELFNLMTIGVGGYIVGRSGEKIAGQINLGNKK